MDYKKYKDLMISYSELNTDSAAPGDNEEEIRRKIEYIISDRRRDIYCEIYLGANQKKDK